MKTLLRVVGLLYSFFLKAVIVLQSPFLLVVRLCWGWQFLDSGLGKISNIDKTIAFFTDLHIPAPSFNAHLNAGLETVGGILLMLGLGSRVISFPLVISMTVAFLTAERQKFMAFFSDSGTFFGADAFPFLLAALLVLLFGPGFFSVDTLIAAYRAFKKQGPSPLGRVKMLVLLWVVFMLVYITVYAGFGGDPIQLIHRWWNILIAIALFAVAYAALQLLFKKSVLKEQ